MEKMELSAQELMRVLNWKKSKAYYWINSGKFETVERADGIKALLTSEDIKRYKTPESFEQFENGSEQFENVRQSSDDSEKIQDVEFENVSESLQSSNNSEVGILREAIIALRFALENSGQQTKLLTDNARITGDKYFELRAEYQTLMIHNEELLKKFETLKAENSKLKKELEDIKDSWSYRLFYKKKEEGKALLVKNHDNEDEDSGS